MEASELVGSENLFSFFYDRVSAATEEHGTELDEHTEFYLVNLLVDFLRTRRLVESGGRRVDEVPLAIRLLGARAKTPGARFRELKHLGDTTLYVLGFFSESLRRSSVDLSYYCGVGRSAYGNLSTIVGNKLGSSSDPVFDELSTKFGQCVEVLAEVRDKGRGSATDILHLYEQWLDLGSARARRRLLELGILPTEPADRGERKLH